MIFVSFNILLLQILIQQAISDMKETQLDKMAQDCGVSVDEIDNIVKPIIEACTKDAISVSVYLG